MQTIRTNLNNNASTQYTNYNFTSMIEFNGALLGAGYSGLHKICCGLDDNGIDIDAYLIPATSTLGMKTKRSRYAHFEGECSGAMKISLTGDGKTTIGPYTMTSQADETNQRRRATMGRGLKFNYGKYKIENVDGSSFSLDEIQLTLQEVAGGK